MLSGNVPTTMYLKRSTEFLFFTISGLFTGTLESQFYFGLRVTLRYILLHCFRLTIARNNRLFLFFCYIAGPKSYVYELYGS